VKLGSSQVAVEADGPCPSYQIFKETGMQKILRVSTLAALALGALAMTAQAQEKTMGIVAGASFSKATGSDASGATTKTGFVGGLFVGIPAGTSVVIEPEVLYSMKGTKWDEAGFTGTSTLNYIEVPVLFRYNFSPEGGFHAMAGPAVNFNITCSEEGTGSTSYPSTSCSDEGLKGKTTFSGVVGVGYAKGRIGIEGRYDFDFNDAIEYSDGTSINAKNAAWQVLLRFTK
jgi:hypothetical protein